MPTEIRPIRIEGNVAFVPLTQGYEATIDVADIPLVERWNWAALVKPRTVYAYRTEEIGRTKRKIRMHRLLIGEPNGLLVDHRDCDGLNNRRDNLRVATHSQNNHNSRLAGHNGSGFKGVSWHKQYEKWHAYISKEGKRLFLGYFASAEAAHAAYCKASAELHGEFGRAG